MLKLCKVLMFGVVLVITSHLKAPLMAADKAVAVRPNPTPLTYDGKVVVVDRAAKTVTVEIQKRLYLFKFGNNATVMRKGKKVRIEEIVAGQQVTLQLVENSKGEVLISSADIDPASAGAEAAGKSGAGSGTLPASDPTAIPAGGSPKQPNSVSPYN